MTLLFLPWWTLKTQALLENRIQQPAMWSSSCFPISLKVSKEAGVHFLLPARGLGLSQSAQNGLPPKLQDRVFKASINSKHIGVQLQFLDQIRRLFIHIQTHIHIHPHIYIGLALVCSKIFKDVHVHNKDENRVTSFQNTRVPISDAFLIRRGTV